MEIFDLIQFFALILTNVIILARFLAKIEARLDHLFKELTDNNGRINVYTKDQMKDKLDQKQEQLKSHGTRLTELEAHAEKTNIRLKNLEDRTI